ncbi:hypothetical protein KC356_g97 [Hortaea werneckii]|nr:hypothetical protein KC356_g97 [Hortaea werneckii]
MFSSCSGAARTTESYSTYSISSESFEPCLIDRDRRAPESLIMRSTSRMLPPSTMLVDDDPAAIKAGRPWISSRPLPSLARMQGSTISSWNFGELLTLVDMTSFRNRQAEVPCLHSRFASCHQDRPSTSQVTRFCEGTSVQRTDSPQRLHETLIVR